MSTELSKLRRSIDSFVKMAEAARAESAAAEISPTPPTSKQTASPSLTSEQTPNESSVSSV